MDESPGGREKTQGQGRPLAKGQQGPQRLPAAGKDWVEQPGKMCQSAQAQMMGRDEGAERSHQWPWQDLTLIRGVCRKFGMLWGAKFYVDYTQ